MDSMRDDTDGCTIVKRDERRLRVVVGNGSCLFNTLVVDMLLLRLILVVPNKDDCLNDDTIGKFVANANIPILLDLYFSDGYVEKERERERERYFSSFDAEDDDDDDDVQLRFVSV